MNDSFAKRGTGMLIITRREVFTVSSLSARRLIIRYRHFRRLRRGKTCYAASERNLNPFK